MKAAVLRSKWAAHISIFPLFRYTEMYFVRLFIEKILDLCAWSTNPVWICRTQT